MCERVWHMRTSVPTHTFCRQPAGRYSNASNIAAPSQCMVCPPGSACLAGSEIAVECHPGSFTSRPGEERCTLCAGGTYQALPNSTSCDICIEGHYCEPGASVSLPCRHVLLTGKCQIHLGLGRINDMTVSSMSITIVLPVQTSEFRLQVAPQGGQLLQCAWHYQRCRLQSDVTRLLLSNRQRHADAVRPWNVYQRARSGSLSQVHAWQHAVLRGRDVLRSLPTR